MKKIRWAKRKDVTLSLNDYAARFAVAWPWAFSAAFSSAACQTALAALLNSMSVGGYCLIRLSRLFRLDIETVVEQHVVFIGDNLDAHRKRDGLTYAKRHNCPWIFNGVC